MGGLLSLFSGASNLAESSSENDQANGLLAIIGVYGILQAYMAFEGYKAFVIEF